MTPTAQEQQRAFRARNLEYLNLGHDRRAAAHFIVKAAGALRGPALDIGTGKGLLAVELARHGLEVISIDVDLQERALAELLAEEAGLTNHISFAQVDAAQLPYADGRFGCVAMMDALHHLVDPVQVLCEMVRVVANEGIVLIADFDEHGFELVSQVHRAEGREHARTGATIEHAVAALKKQGLKLLFQANGQQHNVAVLAKNW
jgi:ubiquinone/menaquinone biosynthesis C-methylase UbiE